MPPRVNSRYSYATAVTDASDAVHLYGEEPFRFRDYADNRQHVVRQGDTVFSLAARYFTDFDRPDGLWWIIADFQPEPIHDPTVDLEPGRVVIIPSVRTVHEQVFSSRRQRVGS